MSARKCSYMLLQLWFFHAISKRSMIPNLDMISVNSRLFFATIWSNCSFVATGLKFLAVRIASFMLLKVCNIWSTCLQAHDSLMKMWRCCSGRIFCAVKELTDYQSFIFFQSSLSPILRWQPWVWQSSLPVIWPSLASLDALLTFRNSEERQFAQGQRQRF